MGGRNHWVLLSDDTNRESRCLISKELFQRKTDQISQVLLSSCEGKVRSGSLR